MEKLLLTTTEAAQALGICRSKIYQLIRSGQLDSVRIGGSRRVPVTAVHAFIGKIRYPDGC